MMESIANTAAEINAARFSVDYSVAVAKKGMDTQELAAQELVRMLPPLPAVTGQFIDTYA